MSYSGTVIKTNCIVNNESNRTLGLRATLEQKVIFRAYGHNKRTRNIVIRSKCISISPRSKHNNEIAIDIPLMTPVVYKSGGKIGVDYEVVVTLFIPGSFAMHCYLPVILTNGEMHLDL